jgi:hypothetical protein
MNLPDQQRQRGNNNKDFKDFEIYEDHRYINRDYPKLTLVGMTKVSFVLGEPSVFAISRPDLPSSVQTDINFIQRMTHDPDFFAFLRTSRQNPVTRPRPTDIETV